MIHGKALATAAQRLAGSGIPLPGGIHDRSCRSFGR
jgi:hypothetical protein